MLQLQHIDHVALTVRDPERSRQWYETVLGLKHMYPGQWNSVPLMIGVGGTSLALFPPSADPAPPPDHATIAMRHLAFRVDRATFDAAPAWLDQHGIGWSIEDHAICVSIYFADPDGHRLELTTYDLQPGVHHV